MKRHIVIAGMPRSGSTLLYCLLRHTMINEGWHFYNREERAFPKMALNHGDACTKKPGDVDHFHVINSYAMDHDIRLRWIITIRDPRDVLCSKLPLKAEHAEPGAEKVFAINWDTHAEGGIGLKYRMESILRLASCDSPFPVNYVKYETLVHHPDVVQEMIFPESKAGGRSFSGYSQDGLVDESHYHSVRMHGPRPIDTTSIGQWKDHKLRVIGQLNACPSLVRYAGLLGYDATVE